MTTEVASPRNELRAWLRDATADESEIHVPSLTNSALSWLESRKNKALRAALADQLLRQAVYQEAAKVVGWARTRPLNGDTPLTEEEFEEKTTRFANRFLLWREHVGDKHIRLMKFDREHLLTAALIRERSGQHDLVLARLWREMADGMEGGQTVEDRFTAEEIEAIYQRVKADA